MQLKILAVDDEAAITYTISEGLSKHSVTACCDTMRAVTMAEEAEFDLFIVDYKMPGLNGLDLLRRLKDCNPRARGVLLTAYANKDILRKAIEEKLLFRVIEKPITIQELQEVVDEAEKDIVDERHLEEEVLSLKDENEKLKRLHSQAVIGMKGGLKESCEQVAIAAPQPIDVLLIGETGVGKEVLADLIHKMSPRKEGPLVKINCAAIPEKLLESELFGYVKGAFTGADKNKPGYIEQASGGTLFLDEIGDLKLELQSKFLRVLQERKVFRLGSTRGRQVDFRLITATNRNLGDAMDDKSFRQDLYYRISSFTIYIPPLRERLEDISDLVNFFCQKGRKFFNLPDLPFSPGAIELLKKHSWPGNVRELENVVYRTLLHAQGEVSAENLVFPERERKNSSDDAFTILTQGLVDRKWKLEDICKSLVLKVMDHFDDDIDAVLGNSSITKSELIKYLGQ